MSILVTGGAGYIGAHVSRALASIGKTPLVLDDLSTGHKSSVLWSELVEGSILDKDLLDEIFSKHSIDAVIHLAAKTLVSESCEKPDLYYEHNTFGTANLVQAMERYGVQKLIFSSSCAVYGAPQSALINEHHLINPLSPYGNSKWMAEEVIRRSSLSYTIFRYFNAAGAASSGEIGEEHNPETHLIPLAIDALLERRAPLKVFGTDWPTPDGTCIRDYVHVEDIAEAHLKALESNENLTLNIGSGKGFSIYEIIKELEAFGPLPFEEAQRRKGDAASLVCDGSEAQKKLGLQLKHSNLSHILTTAYNFAISRAQV